MTLADAQFGIVKLLQPYGTFNTVYEGRAANTPLMFSERGQATTDWLAAASTAGYSTSLLRGLPCPMGARVNLWLPKFVPAGLTTGYLWRIVWRMRSSDESGDATGEGQRPFHVGVRAVGVAETGAGAGVRFLVPAAHQTVLYNQTEPATTYTGATTNIRIDDYELRADTTLPLPVFADGTTGYWQQGVRDPNGAAVAVANPSFVLLDMTALGDELLLGLYRGTGEVANWTFATTDVNITDLLKPAGGSAIMEGMGVFVSFGSAP